jgi:hypothetical protein
MYLVVMPLFFYWPMLASFAVAAMVDVERANYMTHSVIAFFCVGFFGQVFWHFGVVNEWLRGKGHDA